MDGRTGGRKVNVGCIRLDKRMDSCLNGVCMMIAQLELY